MARSARLRPDYGVHWADGIAFLVQCSGITNALGVDFPPPFTSYRSVPCTHDIRVPDGGVVHPQAEDPLFKAMSPTPGPGLFVTQAPVAIVRQLEQLSSPLESLSLPFWLWTPTQVRQASLWTNCAPLVLTGFRLRDLPYLNRISDTARAGCRRVVVVSEDPLPRDDRLQVVKSEITKVEAPHLLRRAGATLLTEYMLSGPGS